MSDLIQKEVAKALKAAKFGVEGNSAVHFIHSADYAGMTKSSKPAAEGSWIIDTGRQVIRQTVLSFMK